MGPETIIYIFWPKRFYARNFPLEVVFLSLADNMPKEESLVGETNNGSTTALFESDVNQRYSITMADQ